jgi:TonB-dependent receptor
MRIHLAKKTLLSALISQLFVTAAFAVDDGAPQLAAVDNITPQSEAVDNTAPKSAIATVLIEAQRTSTAMARKAQEEAPNFINLMTAEEMRKLPDVNVAEAVRRIPGISLESDTGEGRFINIRGLDSDLNSTTFGGLRLPPSNPASPFGGGRAVAMDAIPTGLVGALTVTKTNLPEQDAEALGGTIEITPKTAPANGKPFFEGRIGTGYEQMRGTGITDLSFTGGGRFGSGATESGLKAYSDNPFSIVATGTYYEDKRGINDVEPAFLDDGVHPPLAYQGWDQRYYQYHRRRHGLGLDLGYQPDANNSYYVRAFDAGYTESVMRQAMFITTAGNPATTANGFIDGVTSFDKTQRQEQETIDNKVFAIGGKNLIGDKNLDYRLGFTRGSYYKPYDYNSDFNFTPASGTPFTVNGTVITPPTVSYNNQGQGNTPAFSINGANYLNPANYNLASFSNSTESLYDNEWSLVGNLKLPVSWGKFDEESLKVGVSARLRSREVTVQPYSYAGIPAIPMTSASSGPNLNFYEGAYSIGPLLTANYLPNVLAQYQTISASNAINAALGYQNDREDVYALYGQYEMKSGRLGVITGLRAETTSASYVANSKGVDASGNTIIEPTTQGKSYTNFFPSLQARYELEPSTLLRAAFSSTIARPGFNQINPSVNISPSTNSIAQGNPDLKPTTANSFDVSLEKYLPNSGILSIGVFDKEISNYIANNVINETVPNTGLYAGFVGQAHVVSYTNTAKARADGIEFNYEQRFKRLPGLWSGLGAGVNYTLVDSSFEIRPGQTSTLPSSSKNTANVDLFYEKKGLNLRLGAYYVSRNLWVIGGSSATDQYSAARTYVDFGSSYAINENLSAYFNVKNLTNTPLTFVEYGSGVVQREFYGPTYQLGLTINY